MKFFNVLTIEATLSLIAEQFSPVRPPVRIAAADALGRVAAEEIASNEQVPAFARSTVDGYAVRAKDTFGSSDAIPAFLTIVGHVRMGRTPDKAVGEGEAQYIPTGGMLPPGADSVVMIEHVEEVGELLNVFRQTAPGENVIQAGDDAQPGAPIVARGTRLRPQELGVLAAAGVVDVAVYPVPVVGLLSTGDEIVPPETRTLAPGEVRDVNRVMIAGRLREAGAEVIDGGIVRDDLELFVRRARELFEQSDMLIISGGSSVGSRDFTVQALEALGEPGVLVHGVATKPGKPTIIGKAQGRPVVGLPGHPVSALIMLDVLGLPIVRRIRGERPQSFDDRLRARLTRNVASAVGRTDYIRVKLEQREDGLWAAPVFGKSGLISTMAQSDGIGEIPANKEGMLEGEWIQVKRI
ncbi:gephyrin-like molybdotransferase Glp [Paenibacillus sp.]|uniref:molybdopterin molybdotransferase MoeA n=1 Tax=Paenibacillus sp. TaxID=58172 RepID=UPI002D54C2EE|nr:gephyrin-like molybdotransferase Glp [Paenibacillus sp.]HZG86852.1 gephyrin-like molybdotransferase Glp [Paenibacillus sp.]